MRTPVGPLAYEDMATMNCSDDNNEVHTNNQTHTYDTSMHTTHAETDRQV